MAKNKRRIKARIEGRALRGKHNVTILPYGCFAYKGLVYDADELPRGATVNLDKIKLTPICSHFAEPKKQRKGKQKKPPRNLSAWLYSNLEECTDVQDLLQARAQV